jgi:hypothetical protein
LAGILAVAEGSVRWLLVGAWAAQARLWAWNSAFFNFIVGGCVKECLTLLEGAFPQQPSHQRIIRNAAGNGSTDPLPIMTEDFLTQS